MAIKFNPTYVETLAKAHAPGETVLGTSAGVHKPFWALGIPFFFKTYLLIATQSRLLVAEHRRGLLLDRLESVERIAWSEITTAKLSGLFLKKKLKLAFSHGRAALAITLPGFFGPIPKPAQGAKALVTTWEQRRALPSTPAPAMHHPEAYVRAV